MAISPILIAVGLYLWSKSKGGGGGSTPSYTPTHSRNPLKSTDWKLYPAPVPLAVSNRCKALEGLLQKDQSQIESGPENNWQVLYHAEEWTLPPGPNRVLIIPYIKTAV